VQSGPHLVADRYTYLSCVPWSIALAAAWPRLWGAACAIPVLGALTIAQTCVWRDSNSLWDQALRVEPRNYQALQSRGLARLAAWSEGGAIADLERAIKEFDRAIEIWPRYAAPYNSRGYAAMVSGRYEKALEDFDRAIEMDPALAEAWYYRGFVRNARGDPAAAVADFEQALRIAPGDWPARRDVQKACDEARRKLP
jgi:tetratricopeptide (TPR) repeat protein